MPASSYPPAASFGAADRRELWAGRALALVGVILVAVNLRTAVAAVSPIASEIRVDIPMSSVMLGLIGALPPVAFALSGLVGPSLARRVGLERLLVISIVAMVVGHLLRGLAPSYATLLGGSVLAFAGIGVANILLPPLVKRYFADRIGQVTAAYVLTMSISTAVPAVLAAPIADTAGWRPSLAMWSILALASLVPWVGMLLRHRRQRALGAEVAPGFDDEPGALRGIWRSRTAWLIASVMALSALHAYSTFAWGPQMLIDIAGVTPVQAGLILAVYALGGVPSALLAPMLAERLRNVGLLVQVGIGCFIAGYLGLLIAPASVPLLWMTLAGLGPLLFPVALVLINLRSRTSEGAVALSGFVQGIGYAVAALGPITVGYLHDITGGWTVPLLIAIASTLVCLVPAALLKRKAYVEDELAHPPSVE